MSQEPDRSTRPLQPPSDGLIPFVRAARERSPGRDFILLFLDPAPDEVVRRVLDDDLVAGVIVPGPLEEVPGADRNQVGHWSPTDNAIRRFPDVRAQCVAIHGYENRISVRLLLELARSSLFRIVYLDTAGEIRSNTILAFMAGRLSAALLRPASKFLALGRNVVRLIAGTWPVMVSFAVARRLRAILGLRIATLAMRVQIRMRASGPAVEENVVRNRILYAIGTLGPGGAERQLVNTVLGVKSAGRYEPIVVCQDLTTPNVRFFERTLVDAGVEVVSVADELDTTPDEKLTSFVSASRYMKSFYPPIINCAKVILKYKPEYIHSFLDETNIYFGLASMIAGTSRTILSMRSVAPNNFLFHQPYMKSSYKFLIRSPKIILTNNSHAGAQDYCNWLNIPKERIHVIHNGLLMASDEGEVGARAERFRESLGIGPQDRVVGGVMRFTEEKNPLIWMQTAVELSRRTPNLRFLLVGAGALRDHVVLTAENGRIRDRFHLLGHIDDMEALMAALDIYLLTSRVEGLPNVIIEAQAWGVPVVTTPAGGAVEALDDGASGFVAKDWSVEALANACERLLDDRELHKRFSQHARLYARDNFGLQRLVDETLALYEA